MSHRARAIERQIRRVGTPVTVRRSVGSFDAVTSTRTETAVLEVETKAQLRRRTNKGTEGGALLTDEVYYLVPAPPFRGQFTPQDADVVVAGTIEARVTSVRTRQHAGCAVAYELHVSGTDVGA